MSINRSTKLNSIFNQSTSNRNQFVVSFVFKNVKFHHVDNISISFRRFENTFDVSFVSIQSNIHYFVEQSFSNFTFETSIDEIFDSNSINIREISIEKDIYIQFLNFVMKINIDSVIQTIIIVVIIQISVDFATQIQRLQFDQREEQKSKKFSNSKNFVDDVNVVDERSIIKSIEDIEYFDFIFENDKNDVIVNFDRHVYYRNVFVFVDKLKNLKKDSSNNRIREFMISCLRDDVFV